MDPNAQSIKLRFGNNAGVVRGMVNVAVQHGPMVNLKNETSPYGAAQQWCGAALLVVHAAVHNGVLRYHKAAHDGVTYHKLAHGNVAHHELGYDSIRYYNACYHMVGYDSTRDSNVRYDMDCDGIARY